MAPVRKKRVWNFSLDVFSASEASKTKQRRKHVHAIAREKIVQHQQHLLEIDRVTEEFAAQLDSAIAWQQLRFAPPASLSQSGKRQQILQELVQNQCHSLSLLLQRYREIEKASLQKEYWQFEERLTRSLCMIPPRTINNSFCVVTAAENVSQQQYSSSSCSSNRYDLQSNETLSTTENLYNSNEKNDSCRSNIENTFFSLSKNLISNQQKSFDEHTTTDCALNKIYFEKNLKKKKQISTTTTTVETSNDQTEKPEDKNFSDILWNDIKKEISWRNYFCSKTKEFLKNIEKSKLKLNVSDVKNPT